MSFNKNHRYDIQGLRAISVLLVVAYHSNLPIPGGFVGVDMFFVISGFVITSMLERELLSSGTIKFGRFFLRRFFRLIPALALVVSVSALFSAILLPPFGIMQTAVQTGIGAIFLSANRTIANTTGGYFDALAKTNPLLNTWSLSVEEQFYIFFPLIFLISWHIKKVSRLNSFPFIILAVTSGLSFIVGIEKLSPQFIPNDSWLLGFYSPLTRAWEFILGAIFALIVKSLIISRRVSFALSFIGISMIASASLLITSASSFPGVWTILPVGGTLLIIAGGLNKDATITKMMSLSPLVRIGDFSYSIYLWHWPFIVFGTAIWPGHHIQLFAVILSLIPALASYYLIEQPLRNFNITDKKKNTKIVIYILIPPILLSGLLLIAAKEGYWMKSIQRIQTAMSTKFAGSTKDCYDAIAINPKECLWNVSLKGLPIYLVGDSHAVQFSDGVIAAGKSLNRPVYSFSKSSCPFIDIYISNPLIPNPEAREIAMNSCRNFYERTESWLKQQKPGTVIIAFIDHYWTYSGLAIGNERENLSTELSITSAVLEKSLHKTIKLLENSGHDVVVVLSIPTYQIPYAGPMRKCSGWSLFKEKCDWMMPLEASLNNIKPAHLGTLQAIHGTKAKIMNLSSILCPEGICGRVPEVIWTPDGLHISPSTSRFIAPEFVRALKSEVI
jgi:peptidoglycan/LPS O-acetylase OafA/YrhL